MYFPTKLPDSRRCREWLVDGCQPVAMCQAPLRTESSLLTGRLLQPGDEMSLSFQEANQVWVRNCTPGKPAPPIGSAALPSGSGPFSRPRTSFLAMTIHRARSSQTYGMSAVNRCWSEVYACLRVA